MTVVGEIRRETSPEARQHWRERRSKAAAVAFQPKSILTLSQWADRYRFMSADLGEPGPYRTDRVPYLREPMDAITDPRVRRVSIMKSARIGATQAVVLNPIGYCIHQDPTSIVVGLPIDADAQKFSASLLQPMIDDTPVLHERIQAQKSKKKKSTLLTKTYAGGQLHIVGTKSPRALRMVHGRYVLKSEIDAWEGSSGDDGDPYNLIDKRAGAYTAPKYVEESTPLVKETSRIEPAFLAGSQEYYHVPCPHCGDYQRLVWGGKETDFGIKWDRNPDGSPDLTHVYYVCLNGCVIEEQDKYTMVARGSWVAKHPERIEHRSFHLNALVSPFDGARWPVLVDEWYKTERKPEKIRVFVNTILGETYVEAGQQANADALITRRDSAEWCGPDRPGLAPAWAAVLTRSVDTQGDRLETAVWAWGAGEECALIDWEIIPYDPATAKAWSALDQVRLRRYPHASGRELLPRVTFVDAGGHHSKQVNTYCRARQRQSVFAIFGATLERAPVLGNATRNNAAKTIQYPIGVFSAKEALLARLEKIETPGPGYIHLPPWLEDEQVHQLTAEKLVQMGDRRVFKKTRARNEMTDLWVYAFAALHQLGPKVMHQLGAIAKAMMERGTQASSGRPAGGVLSPGID
jgi:phage terminase large subunit GpA-like protein